MNIVENVRVPNPEVIGELEELLDRCHENGDLLDLNIEDITAAARNDYIFTDDEVREIQDRLMNVTIPEIRRRINLLREIRSNGE